MMKSVETMMDRAGGNAIWDVLAFAGLAVAILAAFSAPALL